MLKKKRILLLGNSHLVIYKFRKELIQSLVANNYDVWVSFPNGPFGEGENTSKLYGCHFIESNVNRRGMNPLQDIKLFFQYIKIIKKVKPDLVLAFTVKPDVYGGMASRLLKVPFMPNITGLGKGLAEGGIAGKITENLYKLSVKKANCVFFQNEQDKAFFNMRKIIYREECMLPGSGVNLKEFLPIKYPNDELIRFTFIARVMKAKGIEEFLEAAKYIKSHYPNTEFNICGYCEEDYIETLDKYGKEKVIIYHGLVDNIIDYIKSSHCIVLPSFHPEGVSNVLLEGAACARPLITTDRPGCREAVDDGRTGFLVKEKDSQDLISKMEKFIKLKYEEKMQMGLAGRKKIEREFNRENVVVAYEKEIYKVFSK